MSLLDGLKDAMANPLYDSVTESDIDEEINFEFALEAAVDNHIELSDTDIAAILDDENPDNIVADMTNKDENISNIANDAISDDLASLEAMLDEFIAEEEISTPEKDDVEEDPESLEGCNGKACETEEDMDEDNQYLSLDSLLDSVFNN